MPTRWLTTETLVKLVKRLRERWPGAEVEKIVQKRSKQILYIRIEGRMVKLIVYRDGRVRAFGEPEGVALALRNIAERVLGVGEHRASEG
ncbi:MAG TPA: hypothetical protein EYH50_04685 [Pyrodictium delaneyi]|uniref:Uncharacterized protein n=1 Tax=Pyrodictium delaneyi TaxID=1273541 RepID=A0A833E986_9CREN|nr:hypothetical protein [Pyrodictium delaneyi]